MIAALCLAAVVMPSADLAGFVAELEAARKADDWKAVATRFSAESDAKYLRQFSQSKKGLKNLGLVVIPAPPGWTGTGSHWAIWHAPNDLQSDHDAVISIRDTPQGWRLGPEVREGLPQGVRIKHADVTVTVEPDQGLADVMSTLRLTAAPGKSRAPIFRLNDFYELRRASVGAQNLNVVHVKDVLATDPPRGTVLHAGSLIVMWQDKAPAEVGFSYAGKPLELTSDRVNPSVVYLTGWWVPSIARLPHTTTVTATVPKEWVVESEGNLKDRRIVGNRQTVRYQCDLPISYPKVIGGLYKEMGTTEVQGISMSVFHQGDGDPDRAKRELDLLADAMKFYLATFGSFPFDHYNLYDSDSFYGIESYSYTILHKRITSWAISHEMGHTYFGGVVPNTHTRDSWNEGMTQYVDSVWFKENRDRSLNSGFASTRFQVPLTDIESPWADGSISYMRGAYILHMLEQEIGRPAMVKAMKQMIADRPGKETTWNTLQPYFEKASGQKLGWFWKQWFQAAQFPKFDLASPMASGSPNGYTARVEVSIAAPVADSRLRYALRWSSPGHELVAPYKTTVKGNASKTVVEQQLTFRPERVEIVLYPTTLGTAGKAQEVGFTF